MVSRSKILHFDTEDSIGNFDIAFANRTGGSGQSITCTHTFNSKITIATPIENVTAISLKTMEFPHTVFNVRSSNTSNIITFTAVYGGISGGATVTLPDKNYTSISTLLTDINAGFVTAIATITGFSGFTVVFSLNPLDNTKITIKSKPQQLVVGSMSYGNITFSKSVLLKSIIGKSFQMIEESDRSMWNADTYSYLNCTNNYNLQPDNYFNMNIKNIQTAPCNANGRPSTFKIPLTGTFGEIIYWTENDGTEQKVYIDRPNTTLDSLNFVISDRWGYYVCSNGAQLSFTLNIEYDEPY